MKTQQASEARTSTARADSRSNRHSPSAAGISDFSVALLGEAAEWLNWTGEGDEIVLTPNGPMPKRCTIRPAALFQQDRGFPDVNVVMGRMVFSNRATTAVRYRPFSQDSQRKLRELFLPVEAMPEDDWLTPATWRNWVTVAARLCEAAGLPWRGLSSEEIDTLVRFIFANDPLAPEPIEACILHALTQWCHERGEMVIEIGSYRGATISTLAVALRGVGNDCPLISIDPHMVDPHNAQHVRLALRQIGEEHRLIQVPYRSDEAWKVLRSKSASLVFIDGEHSYEQVVRDFQNYRDLLAPGGLMLFHDYCYGNHNGQPEANPGVRRAVDEHVMTEDAFEPLLLAHSLMAFVKQA